MRIGVFDSGIGGEAVTKDIAAAFPAAVIITINDRDNLPYGSKTQEEIITLTDTALQPLLEGQFNYIVIACNTATANAIEWLRSKYPSQIFIGLEPMVKPAIEATKSGVIAVCATPATLTSGRFLELKNAYLKDNTCIEPDCSSWASMIEDSDIHESRIQQTIESVLQDGADVIVLACTHYHWIRELIEQIVAGRAVVIDPSEAIISRVRQLEADAQLIQIDRLDQHNS